MNQKLFVVRLYNTRYKYSRASESLWCEATRHARKAENALSELDGSQR